MDNELYNLGNSGAATMSTLSEPGYKGVVSVPPGAKKRISIILPVYNEGTMLQLTVLSILHNTDYSDYEILICDQGSTDGCCDFLRWPNFATYRNIKYIDCVDSPGVSNTRNIGMRHASGYYLVIMDAHMAVEPGWLDRFLRGYLSFDRVALLGGNIPDINNWSMPDRNKRYVYSIRDLSLQNFQPLARNLIEGRYADSPGIPSGAMFTTREFFEFSEGFDGGMEGRGWEDLEFSMRAWLYGFRCVMITDLHIFHYYKQPGRGTYKVMQEQAEYNRLRFVLTEFQTDTFRRRIFDHVGENSAFTLAFERLQKDETFAAWQSRQQARFERDDAWWIEKFSSYVGQIFFPDR